MNILELFDAAVSDRLRDLIELGQLRYSKSPPNSLKERRSLGVKAENAGFEILIWESGEVEFGYGTASDSRDEHLVVSSQSDLEDLFARFTEAARNWS